MHKPLNLQAKITLLVISVVFMAILIVVVLMSQWTSQNVENHVRINIANIARMVAQSPNIRAALAEKDPQMKIQSYIETLRPSLEQVEFIVVADMNGIRFSHPDPELIGKRFLGGDELRVIQTGQTYISEAYGNRRISLRAFTPIYHQQSNKQIGFVAVGILRTSIIQAKSEAAFHLILVSLFALTSGGIGAYWLAKSIKKTLFGLEPEQISKLYNEKASILDAVHEGLVAIDEKNEITLINESALKILKIEEQESDLIGRDINQVIPASGLPKVIQSGLSQYNQEIHINSTIIMTNRVPIISQGKIIGAISSFQDKTQITMMAEEITGVKQIVEALRANTHEFMNKLHVILGLIHLDELEEVKKYITGAYESQQHILSTVTNKIKDPTIAGLILGKFSRAKELDINIRIDELTNLRMKHGNIESDVLVTIIGNLVENAMEAVSRSNSEEKLVHIRMEESDARIEVEVRDTGQGIAEEDINKMFTRGYTTKEGSQGVGLAIVKQIVKRLNGQIMVSSELNEGTLFTVVLPKEKPND